ncbi:hypothetical protein [Rubrimonas cliftonensis]|uniref:Uncharacterized protein n=1 Tax=Rubrimonas cliftonensis TaxID=89524 RepID=A0A1H4AN47_9RHOB|nr:hypothetical protein [Rubrimonas cliftonensis]SEA37167.1 hypothetical protein SAMN05444370_104294 [Rubrimonas cliftonensis]
MKRPQPAIHRRPASAVARSPRTRTEAAIELVRAEFERERLDRDLSLLARRAALSAETRDACRLKSRNLRAMLAEADARETADRKTP